MKIMKNAQKTLVTMIAKIRLDVQAYTTNLAGIGRDTTKLAPLVAAAFAKFQEEKPTSTKLDFMKLLATKEQLVSWPENDQAAKAAGSATQALFNGVEYLLRRAKTMERIAALEAARDQILRDAEAKGNAKVAELKLAGKEADELVQSYREEALGVHTRKRITQDEIAEVIYEGWYANMDDFDVFKGFVQQLLALKYAEATATTILEKAEAKIALTQTALEAKAVLAEQPVVAAHVEVAQPTRHTIPFRRHHEVAA